ncbi:MAG: hypothetical protein H7296_11695 [Bacteroidia bacterium]|nr:hypothetical protein [Bacteroidia bacterium]
MEVVYRDPAAFREVNATVFSGFYEDERVLLKDLLFPEFSPVYLIDNFKNYKSPVGSFRRNFLEELSKGQYPLLKEFIHSQASNANYSARGATALTTILPAVDTASEIFSKSSGVSIYFPYSENFGSNFTSAYFDSVNTSPFGNLVTIVSIVENADSAWGSEAYRRYVTATGTNQVAYRKVRVDDAYAELKPTHVVGTGARPANEPPIPPPAPLPQIKRVFIGWARLKDKQYDKFFSWSNGGGSEVKFCRLSAYLQLTNQQVNTFADQFEVHFKRRDITRGIWKKIYSVWDADWVVSNLEQVIAVYEEDTEGTKTFTAGLSAGLTTTLTVPGATAGTTTTGTLGYSVTVKTQDEIMLQSKYTRVAYFGAAKADLGCGFQMCDKRGGACRYDNTFLTTGNWPIYNCGSNLSYTWTYNTY